MSVKKILVKEGLIVVGCFTAALCLLIFLEKKFPDAILFHIKIACYVFIALYAGRWVLCIFKGLMLLLSLAVLAGILWILFKLSPLHLF